MVIATKERLKAKVAVDAGPRTSRWAPSTARSLECPAEPTGGAPPVRGAELVVLGHAEVAARRAGVPEESFRIGMPTLVVAAIQLACGVALLLVVHEPFFSLLLLFLGLSAPFRNAKEPYSVGITELGTVRFRLPMETREMQPEAILVLERYTEYDSEGGVYPKLRIMTTSGELRVPRSDTVERLMVRLAELAPGLTISGAW